MAPAKDIVNREIISRKIATCSKIHSSNQQCVGMSISIKLNPLENVERLKSIREWDSNVISDISLIFIFLKFASSLNMHPRKIT